MVFAGTWQHFITKRMKEFSLQAARNAKALSAWRECVTNFGTVCHGHCPKTPKTCCVHDRADAAQESAGIWSFASARDCGRAGVLAGRVRRRELADPTGTTSAGCVSSAERGGSDADCDGGSGGGLHGHAGDCDCGPAGKSAGRFSQSGGTHGRAFTGKFFWDGKCG